jgi:hypothetical protein
VRSTDEFDQAVFGGGSNHARAYVFGAGRPFALDAVAAEDMPFVAVGERSTGCTGFFFDDHIDRATIGGFQTGPTSEALSALPPERVFIAGRQQPGSRRTQRRLGRYRTGCEGRISHLKRRYGLDRSRLKDHEGQQIWTGWAILAYNADTLAIRTG